VDPDQIVRRIAATQLNLITRTQAVEAGMTPEQLRGRVERGAAMKVHPRVFLVDGCAPTFQQRALAACLACGDQAFVSFSSAAYLYGVIERTPDTVELLLPPSDSSRPAGVKIAVPDLRVPSTGPFSTTSQWRLRCACSSTSPACARRTNSRRPHTK
jgi:hypothetical protein